VLRRAVLADMRHVQRHFPTSDGAARVAAVEAGAAVTVSAGRLFRGLLTMAPEVADLFRARSGGETWFVLGEDNTLTEHERDRSPRVAEATVQA